jgi:hypothetical protein
MNMFKNALHPAGDRANLLFERVQKQLLVVGPQLPVASRQQPGARTED